MRILTFLLPFLLLSFSTQAGDSLAASTGPSKFTYELDDRPRSEEQLKEHLRAYRKDPTNLLLQMQIGLDYLYLADPSRWGFLEQAYTFFEKVKIDKGEDPLVLMYLGRSIGARAPRPGAPDPHAPQMGTGRV